MTDAQLSVLLWQIMRQINAEASRIEAELIARNFSAIDADKMTVTLRGLADSLHNSCGDLDKAQRAYR